MNILSDIILDHGYTAADVIIRGLVRYTDFLPKDCPPLLMFLKSDGAVVPYVFVLDKSDEKRDSVSFSLQTLCSIENIVKMQPEQSMMRLAAEPVDTATQSMLAPTADTMKLDCNINMVSIAIAEPENSDMILQSGISDNAHTQVLIGRPECKLKNLDDMYLYELDPYLLSDLDYYGTDTRLVADAVDLQVQSAAA